MNIVRNFDRRRRDTPFAILFAMSIVVPSAVRSSGQILTWGAETTVRQERTTGLEKTVSEWGGWTLSLRSDGSLVAWGGTGAPPSGNFFTDIAAGHSHGLALQTDGSVVAWGSNIYGETDVPTPNTGFTSVAAGQGFSSVALRSDGSVVAWGYLNWLAPTTEHFTSVSIGSEHFLGLRADGSIFTWGIGVDGEMNVPPPNTGFIAVSGGYRFSLGLKADGSIVAWGLNDVGQCNVPPPNSGFTAVDAGYDHALALRADGSIVAWGNQASVPMPNSGFVAISAGYRISTALRSDGTPVQWGYPTGQPGFNGGFIDAVFGLGLRTDGSVDNWSFGGLPAVNSGFTALGSAGFHLALRSDGSITTWGDVSPDPAPLPNTGYVALSRGGADHALALRADGSIVAWGSSNDFGELDVPAPNSGFVTVAAGATHSLGVKADGSVVAWGWNDFGQCDVPAPNTGYVAVAGGEQHTLGLRSDGSVVAWGDNASGQCDVPLPNSDFVAVAAGYAHSLALRSDGTIAAWGDNSAGQCDVPPAPEGYVAIAALGNASVGLTGAPVEIVLSDFTAHAEPPGVELRWKTLVDATAQFAVERQEPHDTGWIEIGSLQVNHPGRHELSHRDTAVEPGHSYTYRIRMREGRFAWRYSEPLEVVVPAGRFAFLGSSPNPARGLRQVLRFEMPQPGRVRIDVYDVRGHRVRRVVDATFARGVQTVTWNGRADDGKVLPAGVYGVRVLSNGQVRTGKLVMAR